MKKQSKAAPANVSVATPAIFSGLIHDLEEIQRTNAALRGAATGLHHVIDNHEAEGYDIEALFTLIAKVMDQQTNDLIDRVTLLMENAM